MPAAKTAKEQRGRPFQKGKSGNPRGRPEGSRNKATIAAQMLLDGEAEELTRKCVELAKDGNTTALRLCLERLLPPRKDRPITVALPSIEKPEDAVKAIAAVTTAVARGDLTPSEGQAVATILEAHRKAVELAEIERRLTALEQGRRGSQ